MTLETLKDIVPIGRCWGHKTYEDIKNLAIKWVKEEIENHGLRSALIRNQRFMKFHNISEDDLK